MRGPDPRGRLGELVDFAEDDAVAHLLAVEVDADDCHPGSVQVATAAAAR
jgi:hypothetical protein